MTEYGNNSIHLLSHRKEKLFRYLETVASRNSMIQLAAFIAETGFSYLIVAITALKFLITQDLFFTGLDSKGMEMGSSKVRMASV